jgi:inner membrane protein
MEKPSFFDRFNNWVKQSVTIKLLSIGFLILVLLIPNSMLESLVRERQSLRDEAIAEVSSKWGSVQTIGGPVLSIPYTAQIKDERGNVEYVTRYIHFLPDELNMNGKLIPEKRYRSIYVVVLYKAQIHVSGKFSIPDIRETGVSPASCQLDKSIISLGISDLHGINESIQCNLNDKEFAFGPGIPTHDILESGVSLKYHPDTSKEISFSFDLSLNGSSGINFLPFGKVTTVDLTSSWGSPGFDGAFLPDKRSVSDTGFTAKWKVLELNRNYSQRGMGAFVENEMGKENYSSFGVNLLLPVNEYAKTLRSVKYCVMFIIITFLTFFFTEVLNRKRIHPVQYLLVGFAICLFYVLLLSISEHLNFGKAYLIGCLATIALISFYAKHVFKNNKLTIIFTFLLLLLYAFFYSLLQLEDYALLMGSIGLFIILSTIMYLTRKVNWYGEENE